MTADDPPSLRGWFLKEKSKKKAVLPGSRTSSNRRWFTIERIPNGAKSASDPSEEWALCYYKRSSSEKEQRCGWLFLNDVLSLSQDLPNRWITIEHPTRILRMQSPTPAQHRVWFSTLSKSCKNVRKPVASPSSPAPLSEERPSLPYFSEEKVRKAKRNSLRDAKDPVASTPMDELQFLRQITGKGSEESKEMPKQLFIDSSSVSSTTEDTAIEVEVNQKRGALANGDSGEGRDDPTDRRYSGEVSCGTNDTETLGDSGEGKDDPTNIGCNSGVVGSGTNNTEALGARLGKSILSSLPPESEEKTEVEPLSYDGYGFEEIKEGRYGSFSFRNNSDVLNQAPADGNVNMYELRKALSNRSLNNKLHFGNEDDDEIVPDDDFLNDDWDE
ncbi:hypothetical protein ACHAWF_016874 [Thalassiosira exigua]